MNTPFNSPELVEGYETLNLNMLSKMRVVLDIDEPLEPCQRMNLAMIKQLTGGDTVHVRPVFKEA